MFIAALLKNQSSVGATCRPHGAKIPKKFSQNYKHSVPMEPQPVMVNFGVSAKIVFNETNVRAPRDTSRSAWLVDSANVPGCLTAGMSERMAATDL